VRGDKVFTVLTKPATSRTIYYEYVSRDRPSILTPQNSTVFFASSRELVGTRHRRFTDNKE
jgi:hypothetical protein